MTSSDEALMCIEEKLGGANLSLSLKNVIGKVFQFHAKGSPRCVIAGTIQAIDISSDDGYIQLCVSNRRFRGDIVRSIVHVNGVWEIWLDSPLPSDCRIRGELTVY
jgi:hypothetical protein